MTTAAPKIRTPRGKFLTVRQYLALVVAQQGRRGREAQVCSSKHFNCAAWENGPCFAELAATTNWADWES